MRRRFQQLLPNRPLSALYAINVFGSIPCILPSYPLQQWHRATSHSIPPLVCYGHRSGGTMGIRYASKRESKIIMAVLKLVDELCLW